jgi:hypothetical protein
MPFVNDEVRDQGLDYADANGDRLDICSQEPTNYTEATSTYSLGNAVVNTGATQDGTVDGRAVQVPAISGANVTATGTATHWALTDGSSVLIATGPLATSQLVTNGNTYDPRSCLMTTHYVKQNDTAPVIEATLYGPDGRVVDLTGANSVRFHMRRVGETALKVNAAATIVNAQGVVQYIWKPEDTDTAGAFEGEFQITDALGRITTYPNDRYIPVTITDDI